MRKLKKTLKKKVNPEKSNKMIIAVSAGLVVLFVLLFMLATSGSGGGDKEEVIPKTLKYLKKVNGIIDLKTETEPITVTLVYDKNIKKDFPKIALYAGYKLTSRIKDEKITMQVAENTPNNLVYKVVLKNDKIISENLFKQNN